MKIRSYIGVIILSGALLFCHTVSGAVISSSTTTGNLSEGGSARISLAGKSASAEVLIRKSNFHDGDEDGYDVIWVSPSISNLSNQALGIIVSTSFYDDSDNLVLAFSQQWHRLEKGAKNFQLASGFQRIPSALLGKIASARVSLIKSKPFRD